MRTLLLILCFITANKVYSQTFKVSDLKANGLDAQEIQQKKKEGLGAKVEMTFYDNSVKVILYKLNGEKEDEFVLEQSSKDPNEYISIQKSKTRQFEMKLTLTTLINYIRSASLKNTWKKIDNSGQVYEEGSIIITLKRE